MDADRQVAANHNRRMANEGRMLDRQEAEWNKRWNKADSMIGQLVRDGKVVYYAWPTGGKYKEGTEQELRTWLMKKYV